VVRTVAIAVPGDLDSPTGGYAYDRRMIRELKRLGWQVEVVQLGDGFPFPTDEQKRNATMQLTEIPTGRPIVVDGLAFGAIPEAAAELCRGHPLIALVHHPLALETGLTVTRANKLRASERAALAVTRHVIVTSRATARLLVADYHVPIERVTVAFPGNDSVVPARGSNDGIVRLLSVGSVVPRKGFDVLIAALATLAKLPWHLTIAGDRGRDPAAVTQLDADIARYGLSGRVAALGALSSEGLRELYARADLFVMASRFEGYGMAFAEAIAHGLPVVGTAVGALPDTIPKGAGVLVAPDDTAALATALRRLINSAAERRRMAVNARAAAQALPRWQDSAKLFAAAIESAL
jgi:glycosyltransferase involved in cell wall biosynthesis